ncbi:hypothetical protein JCM10207_008823 [Rhodosporidiobolus poonsookiae]
MAPLSFALELPSAFKTLSLETAGSPAPWATAPPAAPLRNRILLLALVSLSRALADSTETTALLAASLAKTQDKAEQQRLAVAQAKQAVLEASRAAQAAHGEAKRAEKAVSGGAFKAGADGVVAEVEREVLTRLGGTKKGKERAREDSEENGGGGFNLDPLLHQLAVDLRLDSQAVCAALDSGDVELDPEWQNIEDDLVASLLVRLAEHTGSPYMPTLRLPLDGSSVDSTKAASLPPTPPASVHLSEFDSSLEDEEENDSLPSADTLPDSTNSEVFAIVHPALLALFHLHTLLSSRLAASLANFDALVQLSAAAVEAHRNAAKRLGKTLAKVRDLHELELREREEVERVMEELRVTAVEFAKWRLGRSDDDEDG